MISKIDHIKNMALYKNFDWSKSLRDKGNNHTSFKKINIFYGRNYSGKTTLSRVLRAFEIGAISDKYESPLFKLSFDDGGSLNENNLNTHNKIIRVFNEDFIKDNLSFIIDDEQTIKSFAILGKDNTEIERKIEEHKLELGKDESGLMGELLKATKSFGEAKETFNNRKGSLDKMLSEKANNSKTGIKHNKLFGNANYNVPKLMKDIGIVNNSSYICQTDEQIDKSNRILKEEAKNEIPNAAPFNLQYSEIVVKARELLNKKIQATNPINELLNDVL